MLLLVVLLLLQLLLLPEELPLVKSVVAFSGSGEPAAAVLFAAPDVTFDVCFGLLFQLI